MSATGRGERLGGEHDYYPTPAWCVDRLMEAWQPPPGLIVEPAAGDGAIVKAVSKHVKAEWVTLDIAPDYWRSDPRREPSDFLLLNGTDYGHRVGSAVTNPPYGLAEQFIRQARKLYPQAEICFLLRLNFLASDAREALYAEVGMPDVYVLPNRPSFRNGRTDACEYAWFMWPPVPRDWGITRRLALTPKAERCKK